MHMDSETYRAKFEEVAAKSSKATIVELDQGMLGIDIGEGVIITLSGSEETGDLQWVVYSYLTEDGVQGPDPEGFG